MFDKFFDRLFNGSNEKEIKKIRKIVEQQINPLEDGLKKLSDSSLANKTNEFKARLAGRNKGLRWHRCNSQPRQRLYLSFS